MTNDLDVILLVVFGTLGAFAALLYLLAVLEPAAVVVPQESSRLMRPIQEHGPMSHSQAA